MKKRLAVLALVATVSIALPAAAEPLHNHHHRRPVRHIVHRIARALHHHHHRHRHHHPR